MMLVSRAAATRKPKSYRCGGSWPFWLLIHALLWLLTGPALRSAVQVRQYGVQYLAAGCGWDDAVASQPSWRRKDRLSAKLHNAPAVCPAVAPLTRHAASTQVIDHSTNAEREGQELLGIRVLRDWHHRIENVSPIVLAHPPVLG
jgi:hypothetical protein